MMDQEKMESLARQLGEYGKPFSSATQAELACGASDASRAIDDLLEERRALRDERDEARGVLASLADAINTWCRENSLEEVRDPFSLDETRRGVERLALLAAKYRIERDQLRTLMEDSSL